MLAVGAVNCLPGSISSQFKPIPQGMGCRKVVGLLYHKKERDLIESNFYKTEMSTFLLLTLLICGGGGDGGF